MSVHFSSKRSAPEGFISCAAKGLSLLLECQWQGLLHCSEAASHPTDVAHVCL